MSAHIYTTHRRVPPKTGEPATFASHDICNIHMQANVYWYTAMSLDHTFNIRLFRTTNPIIFFLFSLLFPLVSLFCLYTLSFLLANDPFPFSTSDAALRVCIYLWFISPAKPGFWENWFILKSGAAHSIYLFKKNSACSPSQFASILQPPRHRIHCTIFPILCTRCLF